MARGLEVVTMWRNGSHPLILAYPSQGLDREWGGLKGRPLSISRIRMGRIPRNYGTGNLPACLCVVEGQH